MLRVVSSCPEAAKLGRIPHIVGGYICNIETAGEGKFKKFWRASVL